MVYEKYGYFFVVYEIFAVYSMMSEDLSNEGNIKVFYRQLNIDRINWKL